MSSQPADSAPGPGYRLALLNPLPTTLGHYQQALAATLEAAGAGPVFAWCPSVELAGAGVRARMSAAVELVGARRRAVRLAGDGAVMSLWPSIGLAEPAWWPRSARVWHLIHDPRPLRRQTGYGSAAARAGRGGLGPRAGLVVHAQPAADELDRMGWPNALLLPHPILAPTGPGAGAPHTGAPCADRDGVLVLGQHKPVRDLAALLTLADQADAGASLRIAGRGWPTVPGWQVESRFLSEREVEEQLRRAGCLVLPYRHYYVSGVAVRALEQLTPVVARRHPMLEMLLGPDWPGFVDAEQWGAAVARARAVGATQMVARREAYAARSAAAWGQFVAWLSGAGTADVGGRQPGEPLPGTRPAPGPCPTPAGASQQPASQQPASTQAPAPDGTSTPPPLPAPATGRR